MVESNQYESVHKQFPRQGFATPCQILQLTEVDLEALGSGPLGHHKKIYKAIKNMKAQVRRMTLIRVLFTNKKYNQKLKQNCS